MAFEEFEQALIEVKMDQYLETVRPPLNIRPELDLGYRIENQSVTLLEIRPHYKTGERMEAGYAKATFSKVDKAWKIYWHRADGKWHRYAPMPSLSRIEDFMKLLDEDKNACFKG